MIVSHRSHVQYTFEETLERLAAEQVQREPHRRSRGRFASASAFEAWIRIAPDAASVAKQSTNRTDPMLEMTNAVRRLEAAFTGTSLSAAQLKQLHRAVALLVHPDRHEPAHRPLAEELMKKVNVLIGPTLRPAVERT